jgi:hypothetical protein
VTTLKLLVTLLALLIVGTVAGLAIRAMSPTAILLLPLGEIYLANLKGTFSKGPSAGPLSSFPSGANREP